MSGSIGTVSYWKDSAGISADGGGTEPSHSDVCIVGGGIAGLTTAYKLALAGKSVTVIDAGSPGSGETSRTTAHLSNAIDDRIYRIEEWHGEEKARLAVESHTRAIDEIERIVAAENIECDFRRVDGYLVEAPDGTDDLEKELHAARQCGLEVEMMPQAPIAAYGGTRCLKFPRQGQFHVLKYLRGLLDAFEKAGGKFVSDSRVVEWIGGESPAVSTADGRRFTADSVVLATNYPLISKMFAELPAYRTYTVGIKVPKDSVPAILLWDTADPYVYVRTQPMDDGDLLIIGGEDHRTGQADDGRERFDRLIAWGKKNVKFSGEMISGDVEYEWSGQCLETHDGLAFIGRFSASEPNVYLVTGDSGMGMTHGTIGGMLVSDLILGRQNPWESVYLPGRLLTQSITEAIPELVDSTVPYADWLTGGDVASEDEIQNGEGAIIRDGLSKLAVYRDNDGVVHRRSAVCTHLGCIVRFNSLEKSWDCPCHGSRFSVDGDPISAPALQPLSKVSD